MVTSDVMGHHHISNYQLQIIRWPHKAKDRRNLSFRFNFTLFKMHFIQWFWTGNSLLTRKWTLLRMNLALTGVAPVQNAPLQSLEVAGEELRGCVVRRNTWVMTIRMINSSFLSVITLVLWYCLRSQNHCIMDTTPSDVGWRKFVYHTTTFCGHAKYKLNSNLSSS